MDEKLFFFFSHDILSSQQFHPPCYCGCNLSHRNLILALVRDLTEEGGGCLILKTPPSTSQPNHLGHWPTQGV